MARGIVRRSMPTSPVARHIERVESGFRELARKMVGPIQALRAGAAQIGSGDLSQRISVKPATIGKNRVRNGFGAD